MFYLIPIVLVSILTFGQSFEKEFTLDLSKEFMKNIADLEENGFVIQTEDNYVYLHWPDDHFYRYDNDGNLLWETKVKSSKMGGVKYTNDFIIGVTTMEGVVIIDNDGKVTEFTIPESITHITNAFVDNSKLIITGKNYKENKKKMIKENGGTLNRKFVYDLNNNLLSESSFTLPTTNLSGSTMLLYNHELYSFRIGYTTKDKSSNTFKRGVELASSSKDGKFTQYTTYESNTASFRAPNYTLGSRMYDFDDKTGLFYLTDVTKDGKSFYIDCFDLKGKKIWSQIYDFKKKPTFGLNSNYKLFNFSVNDDGLIGYHMVSPSSKVDGAETFLIDKETGKIVIHHEIDFKLKMIKFGGTAASEIVKLNHMYIKLKNNGVVGKGLEKKISEIESKKDLKESTFTYFIREKNEVIILKTDDDFTFLRFDN